MKMKKNQTEMFFGIIRDMLDTNIGSVLEDLYDRLEEDYFESNYKEDIADFLFHQKNSENNETFLDNLFHKIVDAFDVKYEVILDYESIKNYLKEYNIALTE